MKFIMTGKEQNTTHTTLNLGLNLGPQWEAGYFLQEPADVFPTYVRTFSRCPQHRGPAAARYKGGVRLRAARAADCARGCGAERAPSAASAPVKD